jgi:hypothetical protein
LTNLGLSNLEPVLQFFCLPFQQLHADKAAVKEMASLRSPLIKVIGQLRKVFLIPLAHYWLKPCCDNTEHHTNYTSPNYLPALGSNIFRLREHIRYALFARRTSNFRMLCPNRVLGLGPLLEEEKANEISAQWGKDTVHPLPAAYEIMATTIENDVSNTGARYIKQPKQHGGPLQKNKKSTTASSDKAGWTAALQPYLGETLCLARPHHRGPQRAERTACAKEVVSTHTGAKSALPALAEGAGPGAADRGASELRIG